MANAGTMDVRVSLNGTLTDNQESRIQGAQTGSMRASQDDDGKKFIEGWGIRYDQQSKLIFEHGERFVEIIKKGAAKRVLSAENLNVVMNIDHNNGRMLAAYTRENGEVLRDSLDITETDEGVKYRFEVPDTNEGDYAYEHIRNNTIIESSFVFVVREENQEWSRDADSNKIRTVNELDGLFDLSIISNRGAYANTSMEVASRHYKGFTDKEEAAEGADEEKRLKATHDIEKMGLHLLNFKK